MKQLKTILMGWAIILLPMLMFAQPKNKIVAANDKTFAVITPKDCSTNIFYNRVTGITKLPYGNYKDSTITQQFFKQAYFELYHASYDNLVSHKSISPGFLDTAITAYSLQNTLLLGVLHASYNFIDSNYLKPEFFTGEAGRKVWQMPDKKALQQQTVMLAALLQEKPVSGTVKVFMPKYMQLGNREGDIALATITINHSSSYTIKPNKEVEINLPALSNIPITIEVVLNNGEKLSNETIIKGTANNSALA